MDELNPVFENFLNNMSRLGGSPRETTRRVSPAKFLGTDIIAAQVAINSRKITISCCMFKTDMNNCKSS